MPKVNVYAVPRGELAFDVQGRITRIYCVCERLLNVLQRVLSWRR